MRCDRSVKAVGEKGVNNKLRVDAQQRVYPQRIRNCLPVVALVLVGQRKQALIFLLGELSFVDLRMHDLGPVNLAIHG
jgi:hypothetical protein